MNSEVTELAVGRGATSVLTGLSFELKAGELVGLIGPNGSGKQVFCERSPAWMLHKRTTPSRQLRTAPPAPENTGILASTRSACAQLFRSRFHFDGER